MAEPFVRPDVRLFLDFFNSLPGPRTYEVGPVEARAMMVRSREVFDAPVGKLAMIRDLTMPGPDGEIPLRLYDAREAREPGPLFLFFHGGGFALGNLDTHDPFCAEMARELDMPVLSVDYRLAPEHPWPAGVEDAIAAARWAAESPAALGREVTGLVLAGDSAGGNFTIVTALALRDEPAAVPVLAQWPIYPAADPGKGYPSRKDFGTGYLLSEPSLDWYEECYCGDPHDWRYSPLVKSQAGLPPTLIVTASLDPIRDQGRVYAASCTQAGVKTIFCEAEGQIHGFMNLRRAIPSTADDLRCCVDALKLLLQEARS